MLFLWLFLCFACSETKTDTAEESTDTSSEMIEGGNCSYDEYEGTCTYEIGGVFTFTGTINGEEVSYAGNPYTLGPNENEPASGTSVDCVLSYINTGTCTPCMIDIGECGSEAFAGLQ